MARVVHTERGMKWIRHLAWLLPVWGAVACWGQEAGLEAGEIRPVLDDVSAADEGELTDLREVYGAWEEGGGAVSSTGQSIGADKMLKLDGFALRMKEHGVPPASISFARDKDNARKPEESRVGDLAWGRQMLGELEHAVSDSSRPCFDRVQDILAFRDWCLGTPGGGNLALAISAEEVATSLLFEELARDSGNADRVRSVFRQCLQNGPTADYLRATLAMEGVDAEVRAPTDPGAAEYLQMEAVFAFVRQHCAGSDAGLLFPKTIWPREGCPDEFNPYALMWRNAMLERKQVALEVCLAIQDALGTMPDDSKTFHEAADKYAVAILGNSERLTSWMTPNEAWEHWAEALAEAEQDLTGLRDDSGAWREDNAGDSSNPLIDP